MPIQLLTTKLNQPVHRPDLLPRPHLLSRLMKGQQNRATLISAPAGFGKTTLALQWIKQTSLNTAWLSLDKDDSDPERFLRYFVAAIRRCVPEFGKNMLDMLSAVKMPPAEYLVDVLVTELGILDDAVLLVLDDYHTISSDEVQCFIVRLLEHLPGKLHIVFLTRIDPPWPLARWRSGGLINELRSADLCFTWEETCNFFKGLNIPEETVNKLYKQSEGWAACLHLMKLSLDDKGAPERLTRKFFANEQMIQAYLVEEVLSHLEQDLIDFLGVTAILDRFCAPLCDFLLTDVYGPQESRSFINRLEKANLFLVPLDREHFWYRYHQLFQPLLKQQLKKRLPPDQIVQLQSRAGEWFAGEGLIDEALNYLIPSGNLDAADRIIAENLSAVMDLDPTRRTLTRWLQKFPDDAEQNHPALAVALICCKIFNWDFSGMKLLLDSAEAQLHSPACTITDPMRHLLVSYVDAQRGFYLYWMGDAAGALQHAERALHSLPKGHNWAYSAALVYTSGSLAALGQSNEALQLLADALSKDCSAGTKNVGYILTTKMAIYLYAGNIHAVEQTARNALEVHARVPMPDYWLAHIYYFLGCTAYEQNFLDGAADYFGRVEQMLYRVNTRMYHDSLLGLTLVFRAKEDFVKAEEYAHKALSFAIEMKDPYSRLLSDSINTRLKILSGDLKAKHETWSPSLDSNKFWLEIPSLTHVEYLILRQKASSEDYTVVFEAIAEAREQAEQHHNFRQVIQFLILKSLTCKYSGDTAGALGVLEEVLQKTERLGFVRTFLDQGQVMAELLCMLSERDPGNAFIHSLLDAFGTESNISERTESDPQQFKFFHSNQQNGIPQAQVLSNRELDVLDLLEKRLTNKEIAQQLNISTTTVKTHTINIYQKLQVNSRQQAVIRARNLGLLNSEKTSLRI